ncbi:MAG TPA: SPOR domain-containing protein [Acetobacteraceae bacterium]|nr:SPOR domain-containing protein [Acetobacteraceae bacterium]
MSEDLQIPPPGYRTPGYRGTRRGWSQDPEMRRLALIAGGIGAVLVIVVGMWGFSGGGSNTAPVIEPASGPVKVRPTNPGGMKIVGANDQVLSDQAQGGPTHLAPPPQVPNPQALSQQDAATASGTSTPGTATPTPPPAPDQFALPMPPPPPPGYVAPAAPTTALAAAQPVSPAAPAIAPATGGTAAGAGQGTQVQLAALDSRQRARVEWQHLQQRMPGLLAGRQPDIVKAVVNGKTFWRLRMNGFATIAQATSFCAQVRAKGASCSIATF